MVKTKCPSSVPPVVEEKFDAHGPQEGCPAPYKVCFLGPEARKLIKTLHDLQASHDAVKACHR